MPDLDVIVAVLREARAFLSDERRWNPHGTRGECEIDGERVVTRCAAMAIELGVRLVNGITDESGTLTDAYLEQTHGQYSDACHAVLAAAGQPPSFGLGSGGGSLGIWNDRPTTTYADVLAAFDAAIATAERQEATP